MNLVLKRTDSTEDGIFGVLTPIDSDAVIVYTLEHAYNGPEWQPKIPNGVWICKRGMHTLEHHPEPFETFEILGVPGHTNLLFHVGNFNQDSEGCVLLGNSRSLNAVIGSRGAFAHFMDLQKGCDYFTLTVC